MNALSKTIRGVQRFLSITGSPYARTDPAVIASRVTGPVHLPKGFAATGRPQLTKGPRRK